MHTICYGVVYGELKSLKKSNRLLESCRRNYVILEDDLCRSGNGKLYFDIIESDRKMNTGGWVFLIVRIEDEYTSFSYLMEKKTTFSILKRIGSFKRKANRDSIYMETSLKLFPI